MLLTATSTRNLGQFEAVLWELDGGHRSDESMLGNLNRRFATTFQQRNSIITTKVLLLDARASEHPPELFISALRRCGVEIFRSVYGIKSQFV